MDSHCITLSISQNDEHAPIFAPDLMQFLLACILWLLSLESSFLSLLLTHYRILRLRIWGSIVLLDKGRQPNKNQVLHLLAVLLVRKLIPLAYCQQPDCSSSSSSNLGQSGFLSLILIHPSAASSVVVWEESTCYCIKKSGVPSGALWAIILYDLPKKVKSF